MLPEVMAALRSGKHFWRGGGRWSEAYFMKDGAFWCETVDEDRVDETEIDEATLRAAVEKNPDDFRTPSTRERG